jgi:type II secretory pathway component GspD/PulD (secretin)
MGSLLNDMTKLVTIILGVFAAGGIASAADDTGNEHAPARGLVLNFHDVPLNAVLTYLSATAGLIIVSDVDLKGKVSVVAEQSVTINEIVDLLGAQLASNQEFFIQAGASAILSCAST